MIKLCEFDLSQNILLYKSNAFSILIKHFFCTVAISFAVWDVIAKIYFSFFTISQRKFVLTIDFSNLSIWFFFFFIKSRTFTFSLKGNTSWLLRGMAKLAASLPLHIGTFISKISYLSTSTMIPTVSIW